MIKEPGFHAYVYFYNRELGCNFTVDEATSRAERLIYTLTYSAARHIGIEDKYAKQVADKAVNDVKSQIKEFTIVHENGELEEKV